MALEQTVEVPPELVSRRIAKSIVGRVRSIVPGEKGGLHKVVIGYRVELANRQLPQLLNLIYGNISIKNNIRVLDIEFPPEFLAAFEVPITELRACGRPPAFTAGR